jgi:hypothetical protein
MRELPPRIRSGSRPTSLQDWAAQAGRHASHARYADAESMHDSSRFWHRSRRGASASFARAIHLRCHCSTFPEIHSISYRNASGSAGLTWLMTVVLPGPRSSPPACRLISGQFRRGSGGVSCLNVLLRNRAATSRAVFTFRAGALCVPRSLSADRHTAPSGPRGRHGVSHDWCPPGRTPPSCGVAGFNRPARPTTHPRSCTSLVTNTVFACGTDVGGYCQDS